MSKFNPQPKPEKKVKKTAAENWKALKARAAKKMLDKSKQFVDKDFSFYSEIWKERLHQCEKCGVGLGSEWKKWNFHHILEKSKRPDLRYDKNNLLLVCLMCHSNFHS
jgi:predicted metal-binding protein